MSVHNLPAQSTPFVGRSQELAEIATLLEDPACRLVTLLGPGGIGKTRLALETAAMLETAYPDGVYYVPLQSISSPDHIVSTIAEAMDLRFYAGCDTREQLLDRFCEKRLFLTFDNFEHVVDGAVLIADILAMSPDVKVLVTSQVALNLREEWIYSVKGMTFPAADGIDSLDEYSAIQLFIQGARRARADFSADEDPASIIRICQALEGIPLGIELAAAWVRSLSCEEIAEEIRHGLDILEAPARNVTTRHRSMRVVLERSWSLLTAQEQATFKRLSVFRGGFSRDAAQVVTGASLRDLAALVDKSFLKHETSGRYTIHDLLRRYGEEQLSASPEELFQIRELHCGYYDAFMEDHHDGIIRTNLKSAFVAMDEEQENIRLAWQWLVEQRKLDRVDELSSIFTHHQFGRGLYAEVEAQMKSAQRQLANTDQFLLCILASMQGRSAQFLGRFEEARAIYRDALKITLKHKDPYMLGANYMWLSETERALGNYDEAKRLGEKARQKVDDPRHQWTQTFVLANLGRIAFLMGDYDEAERLLRESLAIALECGTRIGATDAWDHLGYVQLALAKRQEAQHDFESGLRVAREIGYEIGIMLALSGLAETAWRSDARAEAMAYLREAFEFVGTSHVPPDLILYAFVIMAEIVAAENQPAQAIQLLNIVRRHTASPEQTRERAETLLHKLATDSGMVADTSAELPRLEQVAKALLENELAAAGAPKSPNRASADLLNERELEILQLIADGLSNREIAARLYLALGTVKWYINQIYGKLNVTSRTQAVALARESQILP